MTTTSQSSTDTGVRQITVLLYSDNKNTRDAVRLAVGRRPARDVEVVAWQEFASANAAIHALDQGGIDLMILDGEAQPYGGMGMCRQIKNEVFPVPPAIVLTGRAQDGWLAAWSLADAAVPHPIDPIVLCRTVADVARHPERVIGPEAGETR